MTEVRRGDAATRGRGESGFAPSPVRRVASSFCLLALFGCGPAPATRRPPPGDDRRFLFTEIAQQAGIRFEHKNGQGAGANIVETTGSGCGVFDYDNDGWLDIFLVNGKSPPGDGNHLYHNNHDGTFTDVTQKAGVAGLGHGFGMGCAVGDYDGDGKLDLYVTYYGKNILFHNEGNGTFKDVTQRAGVETGGFSTAAAFADLDGDGKPDLYVARYCQFNAQSKQLCDFRGYPSSCPPYDYPAEPDVAYRNMGDGTFKDVTAQWGLQESSGRGLGIVTVDYDRDGKLDLFVANDGTANFLYHNDGGGRFHDTAAESGIAFNGEGAAVSNMGCDFGDFTGDGSLGCTTGVYEGQEEPLWRYSPVGGFQDVSQQAGIGAVTRPLLTFGVGFADLNNDGWLDLFLANGHVQDHIDQIQPGSHYREPRVYLENRGHGVFEDRSSDGGPAVTTPAVGRGLAFGDLFNDGGVAMVVNNNSGPAMVLRNNMPRRHWVELMLKSRAPDAEAIGATVELYAGGRKQTGFVHTCFSFASANDPRLHFGLGAATSVEKVAIRWPDGRRTEYRDVPVDRLTTLVEG